MDLDTVQYQMRVVILLKDILKQLEIMNGETTQMISKDPPEPHPLQVEDMYDDP